MGFRVLILIYLNLLDKDDVDQWRNIISKNIESAVDIHYLFFMLNKAYHLTFIKYCFKYLSAYDLGFLLNNFWSNVECISLDNNVTGRTLVKWFKAADKHSLMNDKDLSMLDKLPDEVVVYRGVTPYNAKNKKALSWTVDRKIAKWFSNRFSQDGEVWEITIPKEKILCYFFGRGESEVIVDLYKKRGI